MKRLVKSILFYLANKIFKWSEQYRSEKIYKEFDIPDSVILGKVELIGDIQIGEFTYINNGSCLSSGKNSRVSIGKHCAIGRYVHITSKTHDPRVPTTSEKFIEISHIEKDTSVGNYVWIGDHVFIAPGVQVGDHAIIGVHSVVLHDVEEFEVVAGVPAKHIRLNTNSVYFDK